MLLWRARFDRCSGKSSKERIGGVSQRVGGCRAEESHENFESDEDIVSEGDRKGTLGMQDDLHGGGDDEQEGVWLTPKKRVATRDDLRRESVVRLLGAVGTVCRRPVHRAAPSAENCNLLEHKELVGEDDDVDFEREDRLREGRVVDELLL
jgi:hypothetical protein